MATARPGDKATDAPAAAALPPGRVPVPLTSLVGREQAITEVAALLRADEVRLLTLTGPGGVGKTRLAIAVASALSTRAPARLAFITLAPVRDPDLVVMAIAQGLGVVETADQSLLTRLVQVIGKDELLLVLDNFEHVTAAAPLVAALLVACPGLTVLATSRAALHVSGEREYPVLPLRLPAPDAVEPDPMAEAPAVRLFVARTLAVAPAFRLTAENVAAVTAICARLDGLPLPIELAAARGKLLPPALLLARLAQRLPLLIGGPRDAPARLRTMSAAIAWSHELLTDHERLVFRRLAVFADGFTLEAAEAVCTAGAAAPGAMPPSVLEAIASLHDKSLVQRADGPGPPRFGMLATIQEFAHEQLAAAGEGDAARSAHAAYFAALDVWLDPNWLAPGEHFDDRLWALEAEQANFRAALSSLVDAGDAGRLLQLTGGLAIFWHHRGNLAEGRQWLERALVPAGAEATVGQARALAGYSLVCWSQSDYAVAATAAEAALAMARALDHPELIALSLHLLGTSARAHHDWARAEVLLTEAVTRWQALGLRSDEAMAQSALAAVAYEMGDDAVSDARAATALAIFRDIGHPSGTATVLGRLAQLATARGELPPAAAAYHAGLRLWSRTDARWAAASGYGVLAPAPFPRWAGIDDRRFLVHALSGLAAIAVALGRGATVVTAVTLLGAADRRWHVAAADLSPRLGREHAATTATGRALLGEVTFAAAHGAGMRLSLTDAVALALTITVTDAPDGESASADRPSGSPRLTERQVEVLRHLVQGATDRQIAVALFLSPRTVQDHVSRLIAALGVANRTEVVAVALRDRLI